MGVAVGIDAATGATLGGIPNPPVCDVGAGDIAE